MALTLVAPTSPYNARAHKILVVAAFANVALARNDTVEYGKDNLTCDYLRNCQPLGHFPTLQTPEGYIFESNAIVRFIARNDKSNTYLYGRTAFESSQVDMWLDFSSGEIETVAMPYVYNFFRGVEVPAGQGEKVAEALTGLENWLETRTYLVGERLTVADIVIAFSLQWLVNSSEADALFKKFKNSFRLYNTVMQQAKTVEVLKSVGGSFGIPPAEKKKEEKKEPVKKEEKKPAPKDDDEDDEPVIEDKKKANPLDTLPPSPFVLDAFKREYSNTDTRKVAAPYFFQNFDNAGFSAFWCKYKYNEESKMQFMTANLIRGWFQRMEGCRKYAFGIALISGTDKVHDIDALWIFRGKGVPDVVLDVEDTELFSWTEIRDINAEKEKITDYLCWEGPTIEKPVLEGKCFK